MPAFFAVCCESKRSKSCGYEREEGGIGDRACDRGRTIGQAGWPTEGKVLCQTLVGERRFWKACNTGLDAGGLGARTRLGRLSPGCIRDRRGARRRLSGKTSESIACSRARVRALQDLGLWEGNTGWAGWLADMAAGLASGGKQRRAAARQGRMQCSHHHSSGIWRVDHHRRKIATTSYFLSFTPGRLEEIRNCAQSRLSSCYDCYDLGPTSNGE